VFHSNVKVFLLVLLTSAVCFANNKGPGRSKPLTRSEAIQLSAKLANSKCQERFGKAPFDTSSFAIEIKDGRWHWGRMDVYGVNGYSAEVSFDVNGKNDTVQVYLSNDGLRQEKRKDIPPEEMERIKKELNTK
jgi:hypothetical protein